MKLSISLSTLFLVLPALTFASSLPRAHNGDIYMPRNHARNFGRQRQGGGFRQGQGQARQGQTGNKQSTVGQGGANKNQTPASSSKAVAPVGGSQASTSSCPAPTTVTVTASAAANTGAANKGGNKNNGATASSTSVAAAAAASSSSASASTTASAADVSGTVAANNGQNNNDDPNTSLTLLANLVAPGLAQDGQNPPVDGQVPSLTTTNNFINYCAGKTITNGQQITGGSCNPIPMGDIIPKANMPTCKFASPANGETIPANQPFTIKMNLKNLQAGTFTNAQKTYYMAPQQLNGQGVLIGHSHFVIQKMGAFDDPTILDAATFAFFKGINTAAVNGQLTADVTAGLPAGNYRLASINTDANHAPAIAAVAQHGYLDDQTYFTCK